MSQEIELCSMEIDVKYGDSINVLGDVHSGLHSPFEKNIFNNHIKHLSKRKKRHVFFGGDLLDVHQYGLVPQISKRKANILDEIEDFLVMTKPIHKQVKGIVWGNHEERLFRSPSGKGTMPNLLYGHIGLANEISRKSPELVTAGLQKSLHVNININNGDPLKMIVKHGNRAGRQSMTREHDEIIRLYKNIDIISLHHTHCPYWFPSCQIDDGKLNPIHIFRGGAYVSWTPYADKKNLPPSLMGYWELKITKDGIIPILKMG